MECILYSSSTCPLGEKAAQWLQEQQYAFTLYDYDVLSSQDQHQVRLRMREFLHDDSAPVYLPSLEVDGQVIAVGFSPSVWNTTLRKHII